MLVYGCLQDFAAEIVSDECRKQVQKYMELAAQDVRFDVPLARDCADDRQRYCANVPAVSTGEESGGVDAAAGVSWP